jgi:predicted HTH transcriptional regulator
MAAIQTISRYAVPITGHGLRRSRRFPAAARGRFFQHTAELEKADRDGEFTVRRTIAGNLWSQLDELIDLLALVNFQFRLKAEVSRTVSAYNGIAVKEMIVNAIVHRDYDREEAVEVVVALVQG